MKFKLFQNTNSYEEAYKFFICEPEIDPGFLEDYGLEYYQWIHNPDFFITADHNTLFLSEYTTP